MIFRGIELGSIGQVTCIMHCDRPDPFSAVAPHRPTLTSVYSRPDGVVTWYLPSAGNPLGAGICHSSAGGGCGNRHHQAKSHKNLTENTNIKESP